MSNEVNSLDYDKKNIAELISLALIEDDGSRFKYRTNDVYETLKSKRPDIKITYSRTLTNQIHISNLAIKGITVELGSKLELNIEDAIEVWITNRAKEEVCYPRLSMMDKIKQLFKIGTIPEGPKGSLNVVTLKIFDSDSATGPMFYNQK